jgi:hypothetical protein
MDKTLTEKQLQCLQEAARSIIDPWGYGSSTIARLKKEGLIERAQGATASGYSATEAGREYLKARSVSAAR